MAGRQLPVDVVVVEQAAGVFVRGGDPLRSVRGAVVVVDPGHGLDDAALDVLVEFAGVEAAPFPLH